jgi:DNA-binding response OmpR family regulator
VREAPRILSVGPTRPWHDEIREQLRTAHVESVASGSEARRLACDWKPDVVISEILLEDMTGMAFCRSLREDPELRHLRVLVLSAQQSELDRVLAFGAAPTTTAAPFSPREAAARVTAPPLGGIDPRGGGGTACSSSTATSAASRWRAVPCPGADRVRGPAR